MQFIWLNPDTTPSSNMTGLLKEKLSTMWTNMNITISFQV